MKKTAQVSCEQQARPSAVIRADRLGKVYPNGTVALKSMSCMVCQDDFLVIIGSSGAGKSTLLRCMNRLIRPSEGRLFLLDEDITNVYGRRLQRVRRRVGMIFQQFHLVRRLNVLENVLTGRLRFQSSPIRHGLSLLRCFSKAEKEFAFECLRSVGIAELAFQRADTLSGGQQQRVAIARALAQEPDALLADEPIASLDPRSAETVMRILRQIHENEKIPVIVNLHHIDFAKCYAKRILGMAHGRVVFEGKPEDLVPDVIERIYGDRARQEWEQLQACA
jgi:phosphonate transport system ATP-binding protein